MRVRGPLRACAWMLAGAVACSRGGHAVSADASPDPSSRAPQGEPSRESQPATIPALPAAASAPAAAPPGEARRTVLARLEADGALRPYLAALREHFGAATTGPFELQSAALAGGRTALLLTRVPEEDPIALVVDRERIDWSKLRPAAGIVPPVQHLAIAPHPDGGLVVFAWVAALRTVAARMWAEDGNPFGDFELFAPAACDTLSAAYRAGEGWVVVCSSVAETRAQRMREDATTVWAREGLALGAAGAAGPATLVFDAPNTLVVIQRVAAVGGDRLLAFRYNLQGEALWSAPVQIGAAPPGGAGERVRAASMGDGVVRVELPKGLAGKVARAAEVSADGSVRLLAR